MIPNRVVFDAVSFLQVLANRRGPAAACWQRVCDGDLIHFTSEAILSELFDASMRPKVQKRLRLSGSKVEEFIESVRTHSTLATAIPHRFNYPRDPDDEPYLDLAIESGAHFIVTWDSDLLDRMKPENEFGRTLRAQAPDLRIVTPPDLLAALRAAANPE